MKKEKRYYVLDRQGAQASGLTRWSYINPRYYVMDRETGTYVDEATTKGFAQDLARDLNAEEKEKREEG